MGTACTCLVKRADGLHLNPECPGYEFRRRTPDEASAFGHANGRLWYPRTASVQEQYVRVSLYDVRAAPDLLVAYDYERDGWVVSRDDALGGDGSGLVFIQSWPDDSTD